MPPKRTPSGTVKKPKAKSTTKPIGSKTTGKTATAAKSPRASDVQRSVSKAELVLNKYTWRDDDGNEHVGPPPADVTSPKKSTKSERSKKEPVDIPASDLEKPPKASTTDAAPQPTSPRAAPPASTPASGGVLISQVTSKLDRVEEDLSSRKANIRSLEEKFGQLESDLVDKLETSIAALKEKLDAVEGSIEKQDSEEIEVYA